jgi:OmpA-like transmembrane domain
MNRFVKICLALGMSVVAAGPVWASDWNLLGFYAGAGIGESTVRSDYGFDPSNPLDSHPHHTAYEVVAGIRPLPFVGAEAEYIDFGHPSSSDGYFNNLNSQDYNADSHPKAGVLSAVGYLPLPYMDVFAKAGVARLETNLNTYTEVACSGTDTASSNCGQPVLSRQNAWETKPAFGGGVQAHFLGLGVRVEYERIKSTFGDPDAFMLSATWTF